ncbi:MAG: alcohol dehydrogenase [Fusobacteriaceae bacterium]|jgi:alcohol dehydrogenase YqhD (iron-dependent ADH family)|nr:iron-containing alcohol dehydrogenase [Fusobacteriales bacterium]MDN5303593.1 alcohol dehydrogenase [Fusobacteriaceae bacterium]
MGIVIPAYLELFADVMPERWAKLARRCFDVIETDDLKAAKLLPEKVKEWFKSVDAYYRLSDVNIPEDSFEKMVDDVVRMFKGPEPNTTTGPRPITKEEIIKVYELCK